jgi:GTP-binding protein
MSTDQPGGEAGRSLLKRGHQLFTQPCTFLRAVSAVDQLTADPIPEIAFAGRSNVGKSSLVNALVNRKALARVSNTPGRTREIILFDLGGELRIADLPGYGFAKVSKAMAATWHRLIDAYLRRRPQLKRVCLLVDARHEPHASDLQMMKLLDSAAVSYIVVLTKMDKLNAAGRQRAINDAEKLRHQFTAIHPEFFATSAETGEGLPELRAHLARLAKPADKRYKLEHGGTHP